jgi:hypothetical protein
VLASLGVDGALSRLQTRSSIFAAQKRGTVHMQRVVDGNGAPRRKRYALGADRFPVIGLPNDSEEREGSVLPLNSRSTSLHRLERPLKECATRT